MVIFKGGIDGEYVAGVRVILGSPQTSPARHLSPDRRGVKTIDNTLVSSLCRSGPEKKDKPDKISGKVNKLGPIVKHGDVLFLALL